MTSSASEAAARQGTGPGWQAASWRMRSQPLPPAEVEAAAAGPTVLRPPRRRRWRPRRPSCPVHCPCFRPCRRCRFPRVAPPGGTWGGNDVRVARWVMEAWVEGGRRVRFRFRFRWLVLLLTDPAGGGARGRVERGAIRWTDAGLRCTVVRHMSAAALPLTPQRPRHGRARQGSRLSLEVSPGRLRLRCRCRLRFSCCRCRWLFVVLPGIAERDAETAAAAAAAAAMLLLLGLLLLLLHFETHLTLEGLHMC